jgi:hypothetical protein
MLRLRLDGPSDAKNLTHAGRDDVADWSSLLRTPSFRINVVKTSAMFACRGFAYSPRPRKRGIATMFNSSPFSTGRTDFETDWIRNQSLGQFDRTRAREAQTADTEPLRLLLRLRLRFSTFTDFKV